MRGLLMVLAVLLAVVMVGGVADAKPCATCAVGVCAPVAPPLAPTHGWKALPDQTKTNLVPSAHDGASKHISAKPEQKVEASCGHSHRVGIVRKVGRGACLVVRDAGRLVAGTVRILFSGCRH